MEVSNLSVQIFKRLHLWQGMQKNNLLLNNGEKKNLRRNQATPAGQFFEVHSGLNSMVHQVGVVDIWKQ